MPHEQLYPAYPAPPYGDSEFPPRVSSRFGGSYEDLFKSLDAQPVLSRPLLHPGTGQPLTSTSSSSGDCPTFRHQRPRTPGRPPSPQSATLLTRPPLPPMPPSPLSPLTTSSSTPAMSSVGGGSPIYSPSRSSSTKSNFTSLTSTTASRSDSGASRRSTPRPGSCIPPPQPGRHNSLAELHARQINIAHVQQPISPYAEELNPLEKMSSAISGIVRRKSSGLELRARDEGEKGLKKKSSFARLRWGQGVGGGYEGEVRRGSAPAVDVSKNF